MNWMRAAATVLLAAGLVGLVAAAAVDPAAATSGTARSATCGAGAVGMAESTAETSAVAVETFVAPGASYEHLTSPAALRAARANGSMGRASAGVSRTWEDRVVAYRDVVVHRVSLGGTAAGLADRLASSNGSSPTATFGTLVARGAVGFEYHGATACPPELALNASIERGALRVVPDPANDTVTLVLDTDRLLFYPPGAGGPTTDTFVLGHHGLRLALPADGPFANETAVAETGYQVETAAAGLDARHEGLVRVDPAADQVLGGRTTLAPGSEVTVTLVPYVGPDAAESATATVDRSRAFAARFDLSDAPDGSLYAARIEPVATGPAVTGGATLVAVGDATGAVVDLRSHATVGTILYGPALTTTDGGFVVVRNAAGDRVGASGYHDPGAAVAQVDLQPALRSPQRVSVTVFRDVNGNRALDAADAPYRVDGDPVRDVAEIRLKRDGPATVAPGSAPPTTATGPSRNATTAPGQSGYGPAAAVIAVGVAAGLVARRRG